ncbi:MAG: histidine phosphatase family protein [Rhodobacteraceae bacterium]|nr:histidine phosphatase family protein [Paracoccaceae bacterium]
MSYPQTMQAKLTAGVLAVTAVAVLSSATGPAGASDTQTMAPDALIDALRGGGHVIFIRHATTEKDYADQIDAVMGDCSTQRVLSEAGWAEAKAIGAAFARLEIPVGEVVSSQYCRAWQTADLAFGDYAQNADLNFEPAEEYSEAQIATMRDRMTPHLSRVPAQGNTVLVGHDDPFEAATGIYPEPMGIVFVLRPKGGDGFEILGSISPDGWQDLG